METKQEPHCSTTDEHTALSPTDADAPTDTSAPTGASAPADDPAPSDSLAPPSARAHKKTSVQIVDLKELEDRGYTVVKVEEKHGPLHNAIPCMPLPLAIICCLFNIVTPGIGTLLSSPTVLCCATSRHTSRGKTFCLNIVSGVLQALTCLLIVGWIWSILWGMTFVQLALSTKESKMRSPVPYYVRRQSSVEGH